MADGGTGCVTRVCHFLRVCAGERGCVSVGPKTTEIYEGTNQVQRIVMARQLLGRDPVRLLMGCSGGRVRPLSDGIELPISNGYKVRVRLTPADDYTPCNESSSAVARSSPRGERTRIYCDQVGDAAYRSGRREWSNSPVQLPKRPCRPQVARGRPCA